MNSTASIEFIIKLDKINRRIIISDNIFQLTKTEYSLFNLLYSKPGKVFSRNLIINSLWPDEHFVHGRTIDVNITRLRKKLGHWSKCIVTRSGYGYSIDEKELKYLMNQLKAV